MTREQYDAQEQVLLDALQDTAREAWKLWGRSGASPSHDHAVTVCALERDMDRGRDGFVAFGGVQ